MASPTVGDHRASPPTLVVVSLVVAGLAAAVGIATLAFANPEVSEPGLQAALLNWMVLPYVGAGLLAWRRRPDSRLGPLMVAAGFATFTAALVWSSSRWLSTVGLALDFLPPVLFIHVFLTFPTGRFANRFDRSLVLIGYAVTVGFSLVRMLLGAFGTQNVLSLVENPVWEAELEKAQLLAISAVALAAVPAWGLRRRGTPGSRRPVHVVLVDSFVVALLMISAVFLTVALGGPLIETLRRATFVVIGIAPVAFMIEMGRARLARASVGELLVGLREHPAPADLRAALARALRDPGLTLAFWLPQFDSWADGEGHPVALPEPGGSLTATLIERGGVTVAALIHDAALRDEPELLAAVSAAAGISLENGRLHAELRARVDELAGSRARMIEAGQNERRRLERNLHDGAQQRLVALSLELGLLEEQLTADPATQQRLDQARRTVARSLTELRDVARGIHPAVVSGHGLVVALEELTAYAPVQVRLDVHLDERLPESTEVAAYYLVSESLANIGKHARATAATVSVARRSGWLVVAVGDDGVGGADPDAGSGLRGLADRVEALGGRLEITSLAGRGTRVRAELPCGS